MPLLLQSIFASGWKVPAYSLLNSLLTCFSQRTERKRKKKLEAENREVGKCGGGDEGTKKGEAGWRQKRVRWSKVETRGEQRMKEWGKEWGEGHFLHCLLTLFLLVIPNPRCLFLTTSPHPSFFPLPHPSPLNNWSVHFLSQADALKQLPSSQKPIRGALTHQWGGLTYRQFTPGHTQKHTHAPTDMHART